MLTVKLKNKQEILFKKKKILNILEDEKEIEKQLVEEKAGVEKKVEERTRELKEEQARLTASIKGLPLGFIMIDNNHNIILSNPAVEKILETSEITLKKISEKLGGKFDLLAYCRKCQEEKKMINVKDIEYGQKFLTFLLAPVVMIRDHEEMIGTVILIEDITEAKVLDRSKDEFFSIASHELRTPLTAIRGNTSLIQQLYGETLNKDKDLNEMIGDIHQASIRLITIVNDFLDISRLEVGKVQFKSESYDLLNLIQEVIKGYSVNAQEKNLYLRFEEPEKPLPKVFADKDRTKQVLINLIGNSFKFTDKGGVTLQAQNIDGKFLKVLVADTGQGISKDAQKLIFRKFQQAEQNIYTRDTSGGTGLGLYIAKLIVEGMGGKICLEKTEIGKGTIFSFTLPIAVI
jgi:signal transduction histidine kinase